MFWFANLLPLNNISGGDVRFLVSEAWAARGAIEAGVQVATAYPGTPSSEIIETLASVARDLDTYVEWSTNEKVAFEKRYVKRRCWEAI